MDQKAHRTRSGYRIVPYDQLYSSNTYSALWPIIRGFIDEDGDSFVYVPEALYLSRWNKVARVFFWREEGNPWKK